MIEDTSRVSTFGSYSNPVKNLFEEMRFIFKIRFVRYLLALSLFLRLLLLFFLYPKSPSPFAPDEGTYVRLAEYASRGLAVQDFPGYGPDLYNQSKSLIGPSILLIKLGFEPLDSVRIISTIYGFCVPILVLLCYVAIRREKFISKNLQPELFKPVKMILLTLLFLFPSNFLWSTLGLRESASQFWILAQTYFLLKFVNSQRSFRLSVGVLILISSAFSFSSRPQTGLLFSSTLIILGILTAIQKRKLGFLMIAALSLLVGNTFANTPKVRTSMELVVVEKSSLGSAQKKNQIVPTSNTEQNSKSSPCDVTQQNNSDSKEDFECILIKKYEKTLLISQIFTLAKGADSSFFEVQRNLNRIGASSALAPSNCSKSTTFLTSIICNLSEIPYRLSAFLLRPFLIVDQGSTFMLFAGIENIIWLLFLIFTILNLVQFRDSSDLKQYVIAISLFLILFSVAASLYEGNMGTAFRHKSTLIGYLILLNLLIEKNKRKSKLRYLNMFL